MSWPDALLIQVLRDPARLGGLGLPDWDLLIRQARRSRLLAHLALRVQALGLTPPEAAAAHLRAALNVAESQHRAVLWENRFIAQALVGLQIPVLLLKGGAYAQAGLRAGQGRLLTDIDILVPLARIEDVESELIIHGWEGSEELTAHDQRFYREWMHEIPPMRHMRRSSVIDVHHNILPRTARVTVDAQRLIEAAVPCPVPPACCAWATPICCCTAPAISSWTASSTRACAIWWTSTPCCASSAPPMRASGTSWSAAPMRWVWHACSSMPCAMPSACWPAPYRPRCRRACRPAPRRRPGSCA